MTRGKTGLSRRQFVGTLGAGAAVFTIVPRHVLGGPDETAANDKISIAGIGIGGRGGGDVRSCSGENIVALCDVDDAKAAGMYKRFPDAKKYVDYRKMLDEMDKGIDAIVCGTPDHTHAVICMDAMRRKKHVYCEKPLTHSVHEARVLRKAAIENKIITQVGNQGHSSSSIRTCCEWIWDGALGNVTEVHAACNAFKNVYCQINKLPELKVEHKVPDTLNWDLWLGPALDRPYSPLYVPWNWRGWTAFGTGAIGDWICHVVDPAFWALNLGLPKTVQAEVEGYDPKAHFECYPPSAKVTYEFAANDKRGPIKLVWYDGNATIPKPPQLEDDRNPPGTGAVIIGDKGALMHGSHGGGGVRLIPEKAMQEYEAPEPTIERVPGHHQDWINAMREGREAGSNFEYGGALTEIGLLGMIAIRMAGTKLEYDAEKARFTNSDEANAFINPAYRQGWSL